MCASIKLVREKVSSFESMRKRLELHIMAKKCVESLKKVQRNLDLTKCHGTREIGSVYRGFVISRFFSIHYTITGLKSIVYTEYFVTGSTVCFVPFPTARLHGNWKRGDTVDLISGFRVSVNCGVHSGGSDELGPGHKRRYWRMKNRGVWPS